MKIDNTYSLWEEVYLKTDPDQHKRIVTGINIRPGYLLYELTCGTDTSDHYEEEISDTKDYKKS